MAPLHHSSHANLGSNPDPKLAGLGLLRVGAISSWVNDPKQLGQLRVNDPKQLGQLRVVDPKLLGGVGLVVEPGGRRLVGVLGREVLGETVSVVSPGRPNTFRPSTPVQQPTAAGKGEKRNKWEPSGFPPPAEMPH